VDFDAVLRDPEHPTRLIPAFDSGDHLPPAVRAIGRWPMPLISTLFSVADLCLHQGKENLMEYRTLGKSGLKVPVLSFGAGTFGGSGPLFSNWSNSDAAEARRLIDICLEAGVNLFDTADVYSDGASEEVLGEAIKGRAMRC
jgi:hypothetical protein